MMIHYVMHYMIQKDQYDHSKKVWLFKDRIVMDMKPIFLFQIRITDLSHTIYISFKSHIVKP